VENAMRTAVRKDRARVSVGGISRFGLMEMSRQRLRPSLDDSAYKICPHCNGIGKVRSTESLALSVLRLVGEEARKENTKSVLANIPPNAANYLLNEKREWINEIEDREKIDIVLKADPELSSVNFTITRVRTDGTEIQGGSNTQAHSHGDHDKDKKDGSGSRLNTEHEPVKAWDIEDMRAPNLIDKIKFWFTAPTKKKKPSKKRKQHPRKKASEKRSRKSNASSRRKPRPNKKAKSDGSRTEKDKQRKKKAQSKANKKASKKAPQESKGKSDEKVKKKTTKEAGKKPPKKKAKPEVDGKSVDKKKAEPKKAKQKDKRNKKTSEVKKKEPKTKVDKDTKDSKPKKASSKTSKAKKAKSDKVLPWEDIVPPK
ncbi:MAG: hypothetical protein CL454_11040, partial [Acidimicrobiaceae bacterium]|nr:hypothetical protein [Acidimicrobiaceae bacterium]